MTNRSLELGFGRVRPSWRAKLARDASSRFAHRRGQALGQAPRKDLLGGVDNSDRPDRRARMVEDRRRRAGLAQHGLIALGRDTLVANSCHLFAQSSLIEGLLRQ